MKSVFILIWAMTLSACATNTPKPKVANPRTLEKSCFVSWKTKETKDLYKKGLGKTSEEKEMMGLKFSVLSNQNVFVYDKIENTYLVRFELNDPNGYKLAEELLSDKLLIADKSDERLIMHLASKVWKVPEARLRSILKNYEKVNCFEYSTSITVIPTKGI